MVKVVKDNRGAALKAVESLIRSRCLIGVPGDSKPETSADGKRSVSMAVVAYVQETGEPSMNIPARPFLMPGVLSVKGQIKAQLVTGARAALGGDEGAADRTFNAVGLIAQAAVRATIMAGDFVPLAERTLKARARRRQEGTGKLRRAAASKNARKELDRRQQGFAASAEFAKPLYDKGDLYKAIQYVVRVR